MHNHHQSRQDPRHERLQPTVRRSGGLTRGLK